MIGGAFTNKLLPRVLIQVLPATIIVLLGIGYFSNRVVNETTLDQHRVRLEHIAAQSSTTINLSLKNVIGVAETLAVNDLVTNSLVDISERDHYILTFFQSLRAPGSADARISLADYRGRVIASNKIGKSYKNLSWITTVMKGERVVEINADGMTVAVPVLISGLPEGVIIIEYDKLSLAGLLELPILADAYSIETTDGIPIFSSNKAFTSPSNIKSNHNAESEWIPASASIADFPSLRLHVGDTLESTLAAVKRQESFLILTIFLSVIAVTIGVVMTALMVVNPILHFMKGVERVRGSGGLAYRMEPFGSEEFQVLTRRFNNMLTQVESMTTSRDYVDSLLNSMNEFMLVLSPDGVIQTGNRAFEKFLGCKLDELDVRNVTSLLSGDWNELVALAESDDPPIERRLKNLNSRTIPVLISASLVHQGKQKSDDIILIFNDITQQAQAKAEREQYVGDLERSNADLEQFAYVASHDLKAPLRAIDKLAQFIDEDSSEDLSEDSRNNIKLLRGRVSRLDSLLGDLLEYAQTGRDEDNITLVDTKGLVDEVVELLNPPESVQINVSGSLPRMPSNRTPLSQIFHNLIGNAIKHNDPNDAKIDITCRDIGTHFEFQVADNGEGISEKYHGKIFQMFQTLKRRDEVEGSGIGLAVVDKLVRNNGGKIKVKSTDGERGTTFQFTWKKQVLTKENQDAA